MNLYFCGLDQFNCILDHKKGESIQCEKQPLKIEGITRIVMGVSLCIFQKVGAADSTWYLRGLGVPNESKLFCNTLNISEVALTSECIIGYNKVDNILHRVEFDTDVSDNLTWKVNKVPKRDPAIQIIQIVSNDEKVYCLDDLSGVYEVNDDLVLKWRVEGVQWIKIACAFGHFVALSDTGALYSWGNGGRGELGQMDNDHLMTNCEVPKRIDFFDDLPSIVKDISCGGWHTLVLTSDGDVYTWGWNESGQLGHSKDKLSAILGQPYPIDLGSAEDPIISIAAGARHSFVLLKSGKIFSWGLNKHGQLGLCDSDNRQEPVEIKYEFSGKVVQIVCSRWSSFIYTE